jgi:hypothetical protein
VSAMSRVVQTGELLGVALKAAKAFEAQPRIGGQKQALVSIVFSVVAVEAFLNEVTALAWDTSLPLLQPEVIHTFAQVMSDAEESRASIEAKLTLAQWILAGNRRDKGRGLTRISLC